MIKYNDELNTVINMFEIEHNCKVRFSTNTKEIVVNWNPGRFRDFQPEYNALLIKPSAKDT
jgi:hypothetical protein